MVFLLFTFTLTTAGARLELAFHVPPAVRKLKPCTADEAVTIDGVLLLHFGELLTTFHVCPFKELIFREGGSRTRQPKPLPTPRCYFSSPTYYTTT